MKIFGDFCGHSLKIAFWPRIKTFLNQRLIKQKLRWSELSAIHLQKVSLTKITIALASKDPRKVYRSLNHYDCLKYIYFRKTTFWRNLTIALWHRFKALLNRRLRKQNFSSIQNLVTNRKKVGKQGFEKMNR